MAASRISLFPPKQNGSQVRVAAYRGHQWLSIFPQKERMLDSNNNNGIPDISRKIIGDVRALNAARIKINEEFQKNKNITDEESIKAMIQYGEDVDRELRTQVIQARQVKPGVFEAKVTRNTLKVDNIPYNDQAILDPSAKGTSCCQDIAQKKPTN